MPLLALDLFARIIAMHIDAGPPCMGSLLSSSLRATIFLSRFIDRFLCSTWNPVSSPRPAVLQSRRAQEQSRLAVAPNLASYCALARPHLDGFEHDGTAWCGRDDDQRGARFPGADQSRHDLVSGGSRTRTMMHSCASAAKLRGGGPILFPGMKAKGGDRDPATSNRHRHPLALEATGRSCRKISM